MANTVYVINRRQDEARLARFAEAASAIDIAFERMPALDGHDPWAPLFLYQHHLRAGFWGAPEIKPGAFACYLSHMAAWRRFLATDQDVALICEDDTRLIASPEPLFEAIRAAGDTDLVFAGDRMAAWRGSVAAPDDQELLSTATIVERMIAKSLHPSDASLPLAPGADCYAIARRGAERLLSGLARNGVIAGVDWVMLHAGLAARPYPEWPELTFLDTSANYKSRLATFVAAEPLATLDKSGDSAIDHKRVTPIAELADANSAQPLTGEAPAALKFPDLDERDPVGGANRAGRLYEEPALELMRRWMPEGGVFVDIGAHIGGHTAFMLAHGGASTAIPLEFNPKTCALLREMVTANGLQDRVLLDHLELGVAEERGKRERKGSDRNLAANRLRPGFVENVQVRAGDLLLREQAVDMIKIDVSGDEREALKGLRKTLRRKQPVLAIDLSHRKSPKALPMLARLHYVLREDARWQDDQGDHHFAIFTATAAPAGANESDEPPAEDEQD